MSTHFIETQKSKENQPINTKFKHIKYFNDRTQKIKTKNKNKKINKQSFNNNINMINLNNITK